MGRKFGFSFSWKRALGISAAKRRISRKTGIPLTKSGRQRKVGRMAGCFIATAVYGEEDCVQVKFFRAFRDEILLKSRIGCFLTWLYYKGAPFPAWFIEKVPLLKSLGRSTFDHLIGLIEANTPLRLEAFRSGKNQSS